MPFFPIQVRASLGFIVKGHSHHAMCREQEGVKDVSLGPTDM